MQSTPPPVVEESSPGTEFPLPPDISEADLGLIVQKFGGTSVADAEKIHRAARRAIAAKEQGNQVVVVVSAMGDTTDDLIASPTRSAPTAARMPRRPSARWTSSSPPASRSPSRSWPWPSTPRATRPSASPAGRSAWSPTTPSPRPASSRSTSSASSSSSTHGKIVIVAGFQGITPEGDYTTLGRGGTNATLVAVGAVLKADVCENYTDVDGIYTADPRIVKNARKIDRISYDEMLELSGPGRQRAADPRRRVRQEVQRPAPRRNSQNDNEGTWIVAETPNMEHIVVSGAALKKDLTRVTIKSVPDRPGIAAKIFGDIAAANIVVDDIIQNVMDDNTANISFTVEHGDLHDIKPVVEQLMQGTGRQRQAPPTTSDLAKVSVVGVGMRVHTGVAQRMFKALADAKVNIQNITTSEIKISCIIDKEDGAKALQIVHDAFELGNAM